MPEGFSGDPVTKWCSGDLGFRRMELCETLTFTDHVQEWIAEKGRIIDGASIPRALWTAVGSPYTGRYRRPSIIHDIACEDAQSDGARRNADKMFYRACRSEGLSRVESAILYCGVRFGAWISGGHLAEEPEFPRVTEDSSDNYQQKLFAEITQEVVRDADRLSAFPEETEADVLEEAIKDRPADMVIGMHMCRGNFQSTFVATGGYDAAADAIFNGTSVDIYFMEYDTERAGGLEPLALLPKGRKRVLPGFITTKTPELESINDIKRQFEAASKFVDMDQLGIAPQCGFASTEHGNKITEDDQKRKLELVVRVAHELWGEA